MPNIILSTIQSKPFPTYAKFEAWANSQVVTDEIFGGTSIDPNGNESDAYVRCYNSAPNTIGTMYGSPYGTYLSYVSDKSAILRHAYPSAASHIAGVNQKVMLTLKLVGDGLSLPAVTRNGFTSYAHPYVRGCYVTKFTYWDPSLGKAMTYNPSTMTTPVEFTGIN